MNSDIPQTPPAVMSDDLAAGADPFAIPPNRIDDRAADREADRIAEAAQAAADDLLERGYQDDYQPTMEGGAIPADDIDGAWDQFPATPRRAPVLIHSGHYALYLTPAGLYHLTYQREASTHPDTGAVMAVEGAPEVHFRDLPEHAATMVLAVMDRDQQLPPMLEAFLFGGANPLAGGKAAMMRQMAAMVGEAGGLDQLLEFAQRNGGGEDAGPVG